jgi:hypothetical protein
MMYGHYLLCFAYLYLPCVQSFVNPSPDRRRRHVSTTATAITTTIHMVRNIDLPEALVFYGVDSLFDDGHELRVLLDGVARLLQECQEIGTPVICLADVDAAAATNNASVNNTNHIPVHAMTRPAPNPRDLVACIASLTVQPRSFGGSSGFGRSTLAHPERPPTMQRVVVLCTTADQCRAARYCGARCISLEQQDGDSALADAVVTGWDEICVDDISTPGSFWLNPPHPKDDDGNRVDVNDIIDTYERGRDAGTAARAAAQDDSGTSQSEIDRILADLDPM